MPKRLSTQFIVVLWGLAATGDGFALGFGAAPESVAYGRPLDVSIPLNLRPGETIDSPCLSAEVDIGDRRLARRSVQVVAEPRGADTATRTVRIRSAQVVDEPIVAVSVSAGCADKVVRLFTVFADPVEWTAPTPATVASEASLPAYGLVRPQTRHTAPDAMPADARASLAGPHESRRKVQPRGERPSRPDRALAQATRALPQSTPPNSPAILANKGKKAKGASPRLRLDHDDRLDIASAAIAASQAQLDEALAAAAAVQAAASVAAAASDQRLASIERDMQQLRAAALADQSTSAQVAARLASAERRNQWLPVLTALMALSGGLAVWLALRLRALRLERQHNNWAGLVPAVLADQPQHPHSAPESAEMPSPAAAGRSDVAVTPAQPAAALTELQESLPLTRDKSLQHQGAGLVLADESAAAQLSRSVTVEELIDLEQQAEFFAVLGQDESAVDLLMTHLRATGGVNPLPYLKLLEIYRRGENRAAYDRTRARFNHRFNANAPEWDSDPALGRTLLDHEEVLSCLQASWSTPVDAMAELETLLFRRSHGGLFELPAYRDLLMLYAIARDLHKAGDAAALDVDVILPLGGDEQTHRAMALHLLVSGSDGSETSNEDRPTAPVDLDLSMSPRGRDSVFSVLSPVTATLRRGH